MLHSIQSKWIITTFVIPLAVATRLNFLMIFVRPLPVSLSLILLSLGLMLFNWGFSFLVQIPIHHHLNVQYNMLLLQKLIRTNWIREYLLNMSHAYGI